MKPGTFQFTYSVDIPREDLARLASELRDVCATRCHSGALYAALCLGTLSREDRYRVIEALAAVERHR
jgi:hypothetical protein